MEVDEYLNQKFTTYISVNKRILNKNTKFDGRIWPYSEKDKM